MRPNRLTKYSSFCVICGAIWLLSSSSCWSQAVEKYPYFGLHIHAADRGTAWPKPAFGAWRLWDADVSWAQIEPLQGQMNFERLDRYVAMAALTHVDVLLPLGLTPTWASARPGEKSNYQPGWAAEPAHIEDWRHFVRTVAQRYRGKIRHFDIWNEINEKGFYSGSIEKMVELTCEAYRILHEIAPENRVISPSFIGRGSEPDQLEAFLGKGGKNCIDIVGYHFYVPQHEPEEIISLVRRINTVMKRQGIGHLPLWNTESGWWIANGDGTPETEADRRWRRILPQEGAAIVARSLILGRWMGLERFYWYAWDNQVLGLIEPTTGALKPAGRAYGVLARWMGAAKPACSEQHGTWICSLPPENAQNRRIVWATRTASTLLLPPTGEHNIAIEGLDGQPKRAVAAQTAGVTIGYEPVLIYSRPN